MLKYVYADCSLRTRHGNMKAKTTIYPMQMTTKNNTTIIAQTSEKYGKWVNSYFPLVEIFQIEFEVKMILVFFLFDIFHGVRCCYGKRLKDFTVAKVRKDMEWSHFEAWYISSSYFSTHILRTVICTRTCVFEF